jgi:methylase of polypeptide subunit release factors
LATDILPERVSFAKKTVGKNRVNVECVAADMFEGIVGNFDLIIFYPPAIPSNVLENLGYELISYNGLGSRRCWSSDGGRDGLDVMRTFLNGVSGHLNAHGLVMISVNPIQCNATLFKKLCQDAGLGVKRIHRFPFIMNTYILCSQMAPNKKAG